MNIEIIDQQNYLTTSWSGGSTTQLYILPTGLSVKDDFDLRISSATVCSGESEFSDFSGYKRFLTILQGGMFIKHADCPEQYLTQLQPLFFDGATPTYSRAEQGVVDFNIIWRADLAAPHISIIQGTQSLVADGTAFFYSCADSSVLIAGRYYALSDGQLVKWTSPTTNLTITGKGIYCALNHK